jgi:NADH-quinone oxidoreductase subunit C
MTDPKTIEQLGAACAGLATSEFRGQTRVVAPVESLLEVLRTLKEKLGFDLLVDVTCVDYLEYRVAEQVSRDNSVFCRQKQPSPPAPLLKGEGSCYWPGAKDRFGMVYLLANTETNERITVRCFVNDPEPTVPSAVGLWEGANWLEREVWDLFGIRFAGHPDLRRIVLPEEFTAHPLRKDYPLQGRGERHNFPVITRAEG